MSDILDAVRDAVLEILGVFVIIDALQGLVVLVSLHNAFYAGQMTVNEYVARLIFHFFIVPAIPSILIGIFIHWILSNR